MPTFSLFSNHRWIPPFTDRQPLLTANKRCHFIKLQQLFHQLSQRPKENQFSLPKRQSTSRATSHSGKKTDSSKRFAPQPVPGERHITKSKHSAIFRRSLIIIIIMSTEAKAAKPKQDNNSKHQHFNSNVK